MLFIEGKKTKKEKRNEPESLRDRKNGEINHIYIFRNP
jgi:hypothetical protein